MRENSFREQAPLLRLAPLRKMRATLYFPAAGQVISTWCIFPLNLKLHVRPLTVVVPVQPAITVPLTEQLIGVKMVVSVIVASTATPFSSVFTLTGSGTPNHFLQ